MTRWWNSLTGADMQTYGHWPLHHRLWKRACHSAVCEWLYAAAVIAWLCVAVVTA